MNLAYLDSCIIIYLIEGESPYHERTKQTLRRRRKQDFRLSISPLNRLECRVWPKRSGNAALLARYDRFFSLRSVVQLKLDGDVYDRATDLRARYALQTVDALHLAAALQHGCNEFWTNDQRLANAAADSIRIVIPRLDEEERYRTVDPNPSDG